MLGGDEVNAIVLDVGSWCTKVGYAGEDTPRAVFPSYVGIMADEASAMETNGATPMDIGGKTRKRSINCRVGSAAVNAAIDHMEVKPVMEEGMYANHDHLEAIWDHAFNDRMRLKVEEHPMMLAEPSFIPRDIREKVVETFFESHAVPALFLSKNAQLSSFSVGRQTSAVVDIGHEATVVAAVHDGYVLQKSIVKAPLGGRLLTRCTQACVDARVGAIRPRCLIRKIERTPGQFEVIPVERPQLTKSYLDFQVQQIAGDIKEVICRVCDTTFIEEEHANIPTLSYELPDGQELLIGADRFKIPEVLFQPSVAATFQGVEAVKTYDGGNVRSIHEMTLDCINKCDVDIRKDLFQGVVLTGGTSLFTSARERLEKELTDISPQAMKVKVVAPNNTVERRFSVWIGGSILASLGSFQQMWLSKSEYEEHGAAIIHKKSP